MFASTSGNLVDRITQRWVQFTGSSVDITGEHRWLDGPVGAPHGIGSEQRRSSAVPQNTAREHQGLWRGGEHGARRPRSLFVEAHFPAAALSYGMQERESRRTGAFHEFMSRERKRSPVDMVQKDI